jgi:mRNA-capping enzyme
MRSIKDNITEEVLLNEISEIIRLPLYADRIQRDIKAHQHMVSSRRKWVNHKSKACPI